MSAHAGFWRGLLGVLGSHRQIGWVAVIEPYKAYLDETNVHDVNQWCFVAGHLGTEAEWEAYDLKWQEGLGQRKSLHMRELQWNSKPDRIKRLLARLGPVPDECNLTRIFGGVKGKHYLDIFTRYPQLKGQVDSFVFAAWPCVIQTLNHLPREQRVILAFEHNDRYAPLLSLIENSIASDPIMRTPRGEHRAILLPVLKGTTPRTEAADYLAFEMGQCQIDATSFKATAGVSILGDRMMVGKQMKRSEVRAVALAALELQRAHASKRQQFESDMRDIIRRSKGQS